MLLLPDLPGVLKNSDDRHGHASLQQLAQLVMESNQTMNPAGTGPDPSSSVVLVSTSTRAYLSSICQ